MSPIKFYLLLIIPSLVMTSIVTLIHSSILMEWDGSVYFYPAFLYFKNALFGSNSLAFADQWLSGAPFLADYQTGVGNVYYWIAAGLTQILPEHLCFTLITTLGTIVFAVGQFRFLSLFSHHKPLLWYMTTASIWMGNLGSKIGHTPTLSSMSFFPWILWAIIQGRTKWLVFLIPLQIMPGAPAIWMATAYCGLILAWMYRKSWQQFFQTLWYMFLGLILASPMLIPFFKLTQLSSRQNISFTEFSFGSFHPLYLIKLLIPYVFGGRPNSLLTAPYTGAMDAEIFGVFPGYLLLIGFIAGLMIYFKSNQKLEFRKFGQHQTNPMVFVLLSLFFWMLAFGKNTPLGFLMYYLPGIGSLRIPGRYTMFGILLMFPLATMSFDFLIRNIKTRKFFFFSGMFLITVMVGFSIFAQTNFYPKTPVQSLALIIPLVSLSLITLVLRFSKTFSWLMLSTILIVEIFVMHTWAFNGMPIPLYDPSRSHPQVNVDLNRRYLLDNQHMKNSPLAFPYPGVLGYTSLDQPRYEKFWQIERMDFIRKKDCHSEFFNHLNSAAVSKAIINEADLIREGLEALTDPVSHLACSDQYQISQVDKSEYNIHQITTRIFESVDSDAQPLQVTNNSSLWIYRRVIEFSEPVHSLRARYLPYPGFQVYSINSHQPWTQTRHEIYDLQFTHPSRQATRQIVFEYQIDGFQTGVLIFLMGLILFAMGELKLIFWITSALKALRQS